MGFTYVWTRSIKLFFCEHCPHNHLPHEETYGVWYFLVALLMRVMLCARHLLWPTVHRLFWQKNHLFDPGLHPSLFFHCYTPIWSTSLCWSALIIKPIIPPSSHLNSPIIPSVEVELVASWKHIFTRLSTARHLFRVEWSVFRTAQRAPQTCILHWAT